MDKGDRFDDTPPTINRVIAADATTTHDNTRDRQAVLRKPMGSACNKLNDVQKTHFDSIMDHTSLAYLPPPLKKRSLKYRI